MMKPSPRRMLRVTTALTSVSCARGLGSPPIRRQVGVSKWHAQRGDLYGATTGFHLHWKRDTGLPP